MGPLRDIEAKDFILCCILTPNLLYAGRRQTSEGLRFTG